MLRALESVGISYFRGWEVIQGAAFSAAVAIGRRLRVPGVAGNGTSSAGVARHFSLRLQKFPRNSTEKVQV
jgi:hypothetical protein